ncbi:hypothetical protein PVAP13_8KG354001 [Panicum virgatum]|uniref:Uncharacterized protein n=1 Tax=Panicum virgatum TaxID=38727 RepID=A0A8T0PMA3_PANVG|nr:hypothetical protein PVAP13_8KG354001 [Panicum virgatum]
MEILTEVARSTKQLQIVGFSLTSSMADGEVIKSKRWSVGGHDWEIQVLPKKYIDDYKESGILLSLYLRSDASKYVKAKLTCCLVDPIGKLWPSQEKIMSGRFNHSGYGINLPLVKRSSLLASSYLKDDSFTIECTIEVLIKLVEKQETTRRPANDIVSSSGLHHHLGELLQKGTGADVTLVVSGESEESFPAHKAILASRSPVFMTEFFGHMKEQSSQQVQIKGMEGAVLGAMLQFIYTDSVPELDLPEWPLRSTCLRRRTGMESTSSN